MSEAMRNERISEILSSGETMFNMGMYSELAEICRAFSYEANDDRVYSMLSGTEFALGDYNSAENSARLGLILNPDSLDNMYNFALIMNQKGEYEKALHYFICAKQLAEDDEVSAACAEEITKLENITGITAAEASDSTTSPLNPRINSEIMVLTDAYPSESYIYANMFIHARIKQYQKRELNIRVFCFSPDGVRRVREYDGVEVIEGDLGLLQKLLETSVVKLLLVHVLYSQMWNIIKPQLNKLNVIIFCHGWEIQPWQRREFNYKPEDLEMEKQNSFVRMQFWSDVFSTALSGAGIHFVFVSQSFANEIMEDHRVVLPDTIYSVIHNVIDTDLFKYTEKDPELRKHILLLGSFSSPKYGRDTAINAILKLSEHEEFSDMEFCVAGSGLLWDELTKPLEKLKNVKLMNRFFTHDEIFVMHQCYGIAMLPTRLDSHGVSRDEAMSSGLVPVTNAISAVPEFVDDECGILCPPDDVDAFAEAILKLYRDPELFMKLSKNAASRVRRQSSPEIVTEKELELFEMINRAPRRGASDIVSVKLKNGIVISGYKDEYLIDRVVKTGDYYENAMLRTWFGNNVFKTVFDIGANIGNHTLFFAAHSPDAEIYSFEPMPVNFSLLSSNVHANNFGSRIHLFNKAAGSYKELVNMKITIHGNNGSAQIVDDDSADTEVVEGVVIDELDLPSPDFIKIDTEGYELNVLKGMQKTLENCNALVWLEVDIENALEVYQFMDSMGYCLLDFFLESSNNVLFGKSSQTFFPKGYAFLRLLELNKFLITSNLEYQRLLYQLTSGL